MRNMWHEIVAINRRNGGRRECKKVETEFFEPLRYKNFPSPIDTFDSPYEVKFSVTVMDRYHIGFNSRYKLPVVITGKNCRAIG